MTRSNGGAHLLQVCKQIQMAACCRSNRLIDWSRARRRKVEDGTGRSCLAFVVVFALLAWAVVALPQQCDASL